MFRRPLATSEVHLGTRWHRQSHAPYPGGMREQPLGPDLCLLASKPTTRSAYSTLTPRWEAIDENDIHTECAQGSQRYAQRILHSVAVAYTDVDWQGPRETAGWASLQWQALAWTTLEVTGTDASLVAFSISGAPDFALVSAEQNPPPTSCIEWYRGDYYGYEAVQADATDSMDARPAASVPHLITVEPGRYYLLVKTLYEVRVMGDPHGVPRVKFTVDVELQKNRLEKDLMLIATGHRFLHPDIVDGRVAGSGIDQCALVSVAIRNPSSRAYKFSCVGVHAPGRRAEFIGLGKIEPFTTVKVDLRVWFDEHIQTSSTGLKMTLCFTATFAYPSAAYCCLDLTVPLNHISFSDDPEVDCSYKVTYLGPSGVEMAVIVPPLKPSASEASAESRLTIVVLHGAGVDVQGSSMRKALRRQKRSWVVLPTGITPWGLDWQQASFHSWRNVLFDQEWYRPLTDTRPSDRYFLIGHSNGGQGTWYGLTHLSDRFVGGVVAAGYMSLQEYVPFTWTEGRHSTDPILRAILDAALNDYRNDMHASNLVGMPLLVKYGVEDDNVPPWHSRAMVSLIDDWNAESAVKEKKWPRIVEVPHRPHWWDEVLREDDVQAAIDAAESDPASPRVPPSKFTLTCSDPSEMHGMFGWKILEVDVPGRVARLEVEYVEATEAVDASIRLRTTNIRRLEVDESSSSLRGLESCTVFIDQESVASRLRGVRTGTMTFYKERLWSLVEDEALSSLPRPRQISSITSLLTVPRFLLIVPASSLVQGNHRAREKAYESIARRWAADLLLYISADVRIVTDENFLYERSNASRAAAGSEQQRHFPPPIHRSNHETVLDFPYSIPMGFSSNDYWDDPHMIAMRTDDDYAEYHGGDSGSAYGYGYSYGFGLLDVRDQTERQIAKERRRAEEYEEQCKALKAEEAEEEKRQREEQKDVESRTWVFLGGPKENKAVASRSTSEGNQEVASTSAPTEGSLETESGGIDFIQHLSQEQWKIGERLFAEPGMALLYSLPHPNPPNRSLVLTGSSCPAGIERAGRLLPVRTGTALPEWIVLGPRADRFAAGARGVEAAG
ncbi:hypothetical protein BCV69DRAFT_279525 [Microstroma glucosiphilum]|uniref:Peptidase S9 prolyl oligopeptidase catalytic domain-containing protein n=1 Tax=Pseudomicrostroma glucosiphilum TaxID=1684307 RepID=A0A316UF94_9BASI|nr:hypothetical protein BCV69DRAFT_279525 [Pseudomicrostroma glucosiphilum]PWN23594.1 hypothetical protein BCV69DRAFT_279525 [Pseudomicrostroma glucosiphilum]